MSFDDLEYIENPNAPTVRVHGLHDLDFIGEGDGLFTLFNVKTSGGVWIKETALWVEMPISSIAPGVALTTRKLATRFLWPIAAAVSRMPRMH